MTIFSIERKTEVPGEWLRIETIEAKDVQGVLKILKTKPDKFRVSGNRVEYIYPKGFLQDVSRECRIVEL